MLFVGHATAALAAAGTREIAGSAPHRHLIARASLAKHTLLLCKMFGRQHVNEHSSGCWPTRHLTLAVLLLKPHLYDMIKPH